MLDIQVAKYRRAQLLPPVPEVFGVLVSVDALVNRVEEGSQGLIVMITIAAVTQ